MSLSGKWYGFGQDPEFDAGIRAFEAKAFEHAAELFRRVVSGSASSGIKAQARSFLAASLGAQGRIWLREARAADARDAFRQALELAPMYADLWLGLAMAAGRLSDEATEQGAIERARSINPRYSRAILYEGLIKLRSGDAAGAARLLQELPEQSRPSGPNDLLIEAIEATLESEGGEALRLSAQAEEAAREHEFEIAATLYRQAAQLEPRFADIRCHLAQTLLELDHLEEAESHLRAALEVNPRYAEAWAQLGIALKRQRRNGEAKQAFQKAFELNPHHPIAAMEVKRPF